MLLVVPILEIAVFIVVGREIGIWWTLAGIFITAVAGTLLLRREGFRVMERIRAETARGAVPGRALGDGAMLLVAGVLLLTPGFVTDAIGFLLFVPGVRDVIWRFLSARLAQAVSVRAAGFGTRGPADGPGGGGSRPHDPRVVDLDADEFRDLTPDPHSPWADGTRARDGAHGGRHDGGRNRDGGREGR